MIRLTTKQVIFIHSSLIEATGGTDGVRDMGMLESALKELEARGLIKKVCRYRENGSRTSNMYYLASLLE